MQKTKVFESLVDVAQHYVCKKVRQNEIIVDFNKIIINKTRLNLKMLIGF